MPGFARYAYLAHRYGPTAAKYGRRAFKYLSAHYKRRYARRGQRPYLRGGRANTSKRIKYRQARRQVGQRITRRTTCKKRLVTQNQNVDRFNKILYFSLLTQVEKGDDIDNRQRNLINLSGFNINMQVRNNRNLPCWFNVAVIHDKTDSEAALDNVGFFRGYEDQRGLDFSTALLPSSYQWAINDDKYAVLFRKTYRLGMANNSTNYQEERTNSYREIKLWVPCKRQLRFNADSDVIPTQGRVYFVYWGVGWSDDPTTNVADSFITNLTTRMFWRDPPQG